jgi:hypothetical protein
MRLGEVGDTTSTTVRLELEQPTDHRLDSLWMNLGVINGEELRGQHHRTRFKPRRNPNHDGPCERRRPIYHLLLLSRLSKRTRACGTSHTRPSTFAVRVIRLSDRKRTKKRTSRVEPGLQEMEEYTKTGCGCHTPLFTRYRRRPESTPAR